MVPKVIHYFWEGDRKPRLVRKCIASWSRVMPECTIKEWNLARLKAEGIDVDCAFMREVVAQKKWGFAIDVVRWAVLWKEGGIFLDADVELVKVLPFDTSWLAAERDNPLVVAPGLGAAFPAGHSFVEAVLERYRMLHFNPKDMLSCASPWTITQLLSRPDVPRILPARMMNPLGWSGGRLGKLSEDCRAIHWYAASWFNWKQRLVYVTLPRLGLDVGKIVKRFRRDVSTGLTEG